MNQQDIVATKHMRVPYHTTLMWSALLQGPSVRQVAAYSCLAAMSSLNQFIDAATAEGVNPHLQQPRG